MLSDDLALQRVKGARTGQPEWCYGQSMHVSHALTYLKRELRVRSGQRAAGSGVPYFVGHHSWISSSHGHVRRHDIRPLANQRRQVVCVKILATGQPRRPRATKSYLSR